MSLLSCSRLTAARHGAGALARTVVRAFVVASIGIGQLACSPSEGRAVTRQVAGERERAAATPSADVPLPNIEVSTTPYVAGPIASAGSITGTVELDGLAPVDSAIAPPAELARVCGASVAARTVALNGTLLGGAVVWLEGARRGKPLPELRRHEVSIERCQLTPRVQALTAGGTLHLHSLDPLRTLVRLVHWPAGDTLSTITTNDRGEVVPDDRALRDVGLLEVRGVQPAWMRGWILVFDHPYATTTSDAGVYTLGDVPPGEYRLVAWHERFGRVEQAVTVAPGQAATAAVRMRATTGR